MAWNIFNVKINNPMLGHPHNRFYYTSTKVAFAEDIYAAPDDSEEYSESGTPAPQPFFEENLCFTTDHVPKNPPAGFVFGSDREKCDVLLHTDNKTGISGRHFAVTFTQYGKVILKSLSKKHPTKISDGYEDIDVRTQRVMESRRINILLGGLEVTIEKPWVDADVGPAYADFLEKVNRIPSDLKQMQLQSSVSSIVSAPRYHKDKEIGRGTYGIVHRASVIPTGEIVAIKTFNTRTSSVSSPWAEAKLMYSLKHHNIVQFYEFSVRGEEGPEIIMEYAPGGTLMSQSKIQHFSDQEGRNIIRQTLDGLIYLHDKGVVHRDLKPSNILLVSRDPIHAKLADFGLAKNLADGCSGKCGTLHYTAPEIWESSSYTEMIDMWSVGIIVMELWSGLPKFSSDPKNFDYHTWQQKVINKIKRTAAPLRKFLDELLRTNPEDRMTAQECRDHSFLQSSARTRERRRPCPLDSQIPEEEVLVNAVSGSPDSRRSRDRTMASRNQALDTVVLNFNEQSTNPFTLQAHGDATQTPSFEHRADIIPDTASGTSYHHDSGSDIATIVYNPEPNSELGDCSEADSEIMSAHGLSPYHPQPSQVTRSHISYYTERSYNNGSYLAPAQLSFQQVRAKHQTAEAGGSQVLYYSESGYGNDSSFQHIMDANCSSDACVQGLDPTHSQ